MAKTQEIDVSKLTLDLNNYRTIPQTTEHDAINAMIAVKADRFYGVIESILDDEYLGTEIVIVTDIDNKLIVKEGNRRVATLKLIHGLLNVDDFNIPDNLKARIKGLDADWKKRNKFIPCTIFDSTELSKVDRIVSLTHGKGEKASRDPWSSVARARHNRDTNGAAEFGLNLLEKYLVHGKNLTAQQKERWAGDYGLTVLDEALRKIPPRFGYSNAAELTTNYPKIKDVSRLEDMLRDIGLEALSFKIIRDADNDFTINYGFPKIEPPVVTPNASSPTSNGSATGTVSTQNGNSTSPSATSGSTATTVTNGNGSAAVTTAAPATVRKVAVPTNTPRYVQNTLKKFRPTGNRAKVASLRDEMLNIKIEKSPMAFCFVLRSMFEISAKAYCTEHGIAFTNPKGDELRLSQILTSVTNHLTNGNTNKGMVKILHGALTEINSPDRILSVTSMNQLIHNPGFSVQPADICTLFSNIYPLLEAMN